MSDILTKKTGQKVQIQIFRVLRVILRSCNHTIFNLWCLTIRKALLILIRMIYHPRMKQFALATLSGANVETAGRWKQTQRVCAASKLTKFLTNVFKVLGSYQLFSIVNKNVFSTNTFMCTLYFFEICNITLPSFFDEILNFVKCCMLFCVCD